MSRNNRLSLQYCVFSCNDVILMPTFLFTTNNPQWIILNTYVYDFYIVTIVRWIGCIGHNMIILRATWNFFKKYSHDYNKLLIATYSISFMLKVQN